MTEAARSDMSLLLDVEEIDRDLFRALDGPNGGPRETLYGGQVAAQALAAAGRTVDAERAPHSLHGYFLRPGDPERPVIYHVHRDRDGGSFSARQVQAVQRGEVIFSMLASFHAEKPSEDLFELAPRTAPDPEDIATTRWGELVEFREVTKTRREKGEFQRLHVGTGDLPASRRPAHPGLCTDVRLGSRIRLRSAEETGSGARWPEHRPRSLVSQTDSRRRLGAHRPEPDESPRDQGALLGDPLGPTRGARSIPPTGAAAALGPDYLMVDTIVMRPAGQVRPPIVPVSSSSPQKSALNCVALCPSPRR